MLLRLRSSRDRSAKPATARKVGIEYYQTHVCFSRRVSSYKSEAPEILIIDNLECYDRIVNGSCLIHIRSKATSETCVTCREKEYKIMNDAGAPCDAVRSGIQT